MTLNSEIVMVENEKLRKRVFRMLQSLYTLFAASGTDIQMIDQYMKLWKPKNRDGVIDTILWPYEGMKKNRRFAKKNKARCCLYALVTECLKEYHKFHAATTADSPQEYGGDMDAVLTEIELLIKGRINFPIKGTSETGYYLYRKVRKEKISRPTGGAPRRSIGGPPRRK